MKSGAYFRNAAVGGFNKEDVLSYIDQMNERSKHNEAKLQRQIEELTAERDALQGSTAVNSDEVNAMQTQIVRLKEALTSVGEAKEKLESNFDKARMAVEKSAAQAKREAERAKQLEAQAAELTAENERLASENAKAKEELKNTLAAAQELQRRYNELKANAAANAAISRSAVAPAPAAPVVSYSSADQQKSAELDKRIKEFEEKSRRYDEACVELGRIRIDAHAEAEKIITDAKTRSEEALNLAMEKAQAYYRNIQEKAQATITDAQTQADNTVKDANQRAEQALFKAKVQTEQRIRRANEQAEQTINSANEEAENKLREADEQSTAKIADAEKRVQEILAGADAKYNEKYSAVSKEFDGVIGGANGSLRDISSDFSKLRREIDSFKLSIRNAMNKLEGDLDQTNERINSAISEIDSTSFDKYKMTADEPDGSGTYSDNSYSAESKNAAKQDNSDKAKKDDDGFDAWMKMFLN